MWPTCGSHGGGAIVITAKGNVDIQGYITANGEDGGDGDCGGGAGGSIYISSEAHISGSGVMMANGGRGSGTGGGGGGGRVALHHLTSAMDTMIIRAHGGLPSGNAYAISPLRPSGRVELKGESLSKLTRILTVLKEGIQQQYCTMPTLEWY